MKGVEEANGWLEYEVVEKGETISYFYTKQTKLPCQFQFRLMMKIFLKFTYSQNFGLH